VARRFAYLVAAGVLAALGLLVAAPVASAHATLVSSSPADGAVVAHAPARVTATFDEQVGIAPDSLRVFAPNGDLVSTGVTAHGSQPQVITVALLPGLAGGTYTVGWHVISDDSHPVQGAFTFSVGAPSSTAVTQAALGLHGSKLVGIAFGVVRWLAFCSFALLIGAVAFVIWCWPAGATHPHVLRLAMGAWGGLAFSVLAAVLLQGVYGAAQGVSHVFLPDVLHATLHSRYGRAIGVRLLLAVVALFAFTITLGGLQEPRRRARAGAGAAWAILTVALASTWAVADHSGVGIQVPLAVPADVIHLSAIAIWLGGLVMLATIVLRRPPGHKPAAAVRRRGQAAEEEAVEAVSRFSSIALGCVVAILVTGTYQAWRGVGSPGALIGTTYGRLLLAKIAAMCVLIALGYLARSRVADLRSTAEPVRAIAAVTVPAQVTASVGARPGHGKGRSKAGAGARQNRGSVSTGTRPGRGAARNGQGPGRDAARGGPHHGGPRNGARPVPGGPRDGAGLGAPAAGNGGGPAPGPVTVTLARLRLSVIAEVLIAATVLAVTAVLVNTPTGRETFAPPAAATAAFDTGGPGGRGSVGVVVTPARLGANQVRLSVTASSGRPYRPQQIQAVLTLPARGLGPLSVPLAADGPGRYQGGPVAVAVSGKWLLRITIRSDAFDETAVAIPVSIH
jgi:copper transport protein